MDEYVKHNFEDGQVLHAQALNEMDSAIGELKSDISEAKRDITELTGNLAKKSYNITARDSGSNVAISSVFKSGNTVVGTIECDLPSVSYNGGWLLNIPTEIKPSTQQYVMFIHKGTGIPYRGYVSTGSVIANSESIPSGKYLILLNYFLG